MRVTIKQMEYYTYAYLREDRTPYYIGKGKGKRITGTAGRRCKKPKDKSRIIFLKKNLTEEEAFKHEKYMIAVFGRKDLGTGILRNLTDGGEGVSGLIFSEEHRRNLSESHKGKSPGNKGKKTPPHLIEAHRQIMLEKYKNGTLSQKGEKNNSVKTWRIVFIDGREVITKDLHNWVKKNGYSKPSVWYVYKKKFARAKDIIFVQVVDGTPFKPVNEIIDEFNKKNLDVNKQQWQCIETGFISTPAGLTHYQKKRGIDVSKRKRIL